jgi:hypothetical protein
MRPSIEHSVAAMCLKADVDGDSYRPYVCEPSCDALAANIATLDPSLTCKEPSPGDFYVRSETLLDAYCEGQCSDTFQTCTSDDQCPENFCVTNFDTCFITGDPCFSTANCPVVDNHCVADALNFEGATCVWPTPCESAAECPQGWVCQFDGSQNVCQGVVPVCNPPSGLLPDPILCDTVPQLPVLRLEGVADDLTAPTAVGVTLPDDSTASINHGDALECLTLIEVATGEPCSAGP